MSMTFTKLFSSITASTIWAARDQTRIVWITMLAMADQYGRVWASIPGLANIARVSIEACETALEELQSPDKYSRTTAHEGRRIEPIDGGWRLLNHAKYRAIRDEESIKESKRQYINKRRAAERAVSVENVEECRTQVERCRPNTEADTDTENTKNTAPRKRVTAKPVVEKPDDVCLQVWTDWLSLRKAKRAPVNETVIESARDEAAKAGMTFEEFLRAWCRRGSQGFEASWIKTSAKPSSKPVETFAERDDRNAKERYERLTGRKHPDLLPQHLNIIEAEPAVRIAA